MKYDFMERMMKDAIKEDCELFVKTKNGKTEMGIYGHDLPLILNAIGMVQRLLDQTKCTKEIFDYMYNKTQTKEYGKREWNNEE